MILVVCNIRMPCESCPVSFLLRMHNLQLGLLRNLPNLGSHCIRTFNNYLLAATLQSHDSSVADAFISSAANSSSASSLVPSRSKDTKMLMLIGYEHLLTINIGDRIVDISTCRRDKFRFNR